MHALALALPLCPVREETLLKATYLENWNDFTLDGLLPAQRLAYNLLFKILPPSRPGHLGQLGHHSLPFNMLVHWHLRWNAIPECRKENPAGRYHYLTEPEFQVKVDLPVGGGIWSRSWRRMQGSGMRACLVSFGGGNLQLLPQDFPT